MVTGTRTFLRSFTTFKSRARRGETVRVKDQPGEFLFTAVTPRRGERSPSAQCISVGVEIP